MNLDNLYTVTIVRNVGIPISFTVRRWKAIFLLMVCFFFVCFLAAGSIYFLLLRAETQKLETDLASTKTQFEVLSRQLLEKDRKHYLESPEQGLVEQAAIKAEMLKQPAFTTEGMWVKKESGISLDQVQTGAVVEVARFSSSVKGDNFTIRVKLKNIAIPSQLVGGFLMITLVNRDQSPVLYKAAIGGSLGKDGFPSSYRSGRQFQLSRKASSRTITHKFKLQEADEYYTDVLIFVNSYKGSPLARQSIPLDRKIFLE
ncbi:MAG: hypothetical protein COB67_05420 [SAR324 cluster bacterium]|uniref:Uncharacterized protein n=1 Tax=SAR324 cluster bacterium TaxID=2024889 RepID=A0A2A4T5Q3_9DELT|nr:MAG: hypothetical protein COB67_05420 [SAR324 cluster bacterium]